MLAAILAGESPASGTYPVATVVISGDGAGNQTVGSPEVKVPVGWTEVWSDPSGGRASRQVVAQVNWSEASKMIAPRETDLRDNLEVPSQSEWDEGQRRW